MAGASAIAYDRGDDGIVVLTLDDPDRSANTMTAAYVASMGATIARLEAERDEIAGVIVTSAKETFFAGGDLEAIRDAGRDRREELAVRVDTMKDQLRRLETLGRPVVAAINGAALGGGLEIALACHHRVAVDDPAIEIGFPEVKLGLLPGVGGVVRTVRMLGLVDALTKVLLEGRRRRPDEALEIGLVDALVADRDALVPAARAWIASHPDAVAPWDVDGYEIPGGGPSAPAIAANLPAFPANLRKRLRGANYPAPRHILAAAVEGAQVDFANASAIETRYFVDLACGQVARNMIQAFFFDLRRVERERGRPTHAFRPARAVVLGAGMMGAGIAHVLARAGVDVVLKDVSVDAAGRGRSHVAALQEQAVERGRTSREAADELLARIRPTADAADAAGADLVIEAVFEDPALKASVYAEIEPRLAAGALVASNTSSLPIGELAKGVGSPSDFVGLHFFSPVERMPLLEIVRGPATSESAVDRALALARLLGKTPIVVNDSRGFFTTRVIETFINEGIAMLGEGVPAPSIEQAAAQAGYPARVLQLSDELSIALMRRIRLEAAASGARREAHPADAVVDRMVDELGRHGRASGAGFYEYEDGRRTRLWPGLRDAFGGDNHDVPFEDLEERMLFVEALEAVRCLEEGVVESVAEANVGSILGVGFPGWTGGVLQYVDGYEGRDRRRGITGFVARAHELAERYGDRFTPPPSVVDRALRGRGLSPTVKVR